MGLLTRFVHTRFTDHFGQIDAPFMKSLEII
jgi:hypothetical protein